LSIILLVVKVQRLENFGRQNLEKKKERKGFTECPKYRGSLEIIPPPPHFSYVVKSTRPYIHPKC
jgi:hypothetical protein